MSSRSFVPEALHSFSALLSLGGATLALPLQQLFDDLPNVVFFLKDQAGRYLAVNRTLVERCGFTSKSEVLGRRPSELYPRPLAVAYERQDARVLQSGQAIRNQLELHLYPNRRRGWCLTNKYPISDVKTGSVVAVAGLSRDVESSARGAAVRGFPELAHALESMHQRMSDLPAIQELAAMCRLSPAKFARLVQRVFGLTPRQLTLKMRLDEALHLLATTDTPLVNIALRTGFCDQSAFSRHFRRLAGVPPGIFRAQFSDLPLKSLPTP